jgi:hypothetical protein
MVQGFARLRKMQSLKAMLAQYLLIIVRTILRPAICMMDAAFGRLPERDGHLQRQDREITLHAVTDSPADDASGMQVEDDGQI